MLNRRKNRSSSQTLFDLILQTSSSSESLTHTNFPNIVHFLLTSLHSPSITNFQIFFYYYYFVLDLYLISRIRKYGDSDLNSEHNLLQCKSVHAWDLQKKDNFNGMDDLYNEYSSLINNCYTFDLNLQTKEFTDGKNLVLNIEDMSKLFDSISNESIVNLPKFDNNYSEKEEKLNQSFQNNNDSNILYSTKTMTSLYSSIIKSLFLCNYLSEALILSRKLTVLSSEFDDLKTLLCIMLETGLISEAYMFINSTCLTTFLYDLPNNSSSSDNSTNKIYDNPNFKLFQKLLVTFCVFLIRSDRIHLLLDIPFNSIESAILEKLLLNRSEYNVILLLHYLKQKRVSESRSIFDKIKLTLKDTERQSYSTLIDNMEFMYSDKSNEERMKSVSKPNISNEFCVIQKLNIRDSGLEGEFAKKVSGSGVGSNGSEKQKKVNTSSNGGNSFLNNQFTGKVYSFI